MKKKNVVMWIVGIIAVLIIIIPIGIGEYMKVEQKAKQDQLIKIATSEKAKKIYVARIKTLDKKAFTSEGTIKNYTLDKSSIESNPMGGINVRIYANNNKKLYIGFVLVSYNDGKTIEDSGGTNSLKLENLNQIGK